MYGVRLNDCFVIPEILVKRKNPEYSGISAQSLVWMMLSNDLDIGKIIDFVDEIALVKIGHFVLVKTLGVNAERVLFAFIH